jgi:hypothetical protein
MKQSLLRVLLIAISTLLLLVGCTTAPPTNLDDVCAIFDEKDGWYKSARNSAKRWQGDIGTMMAIMHQESRFEAKAKPPRKKILGFIPGFRPSNAYGYSQALTGTWDRYKREAGAYGADRDDFGDAIDFIGWYNRLSFRQNGVGATDARALYLNYHEGHGGYARGTYKSKSWLVGVAAKVNSRASRYRSQLQGCQARLDKANRGWFSWF